MNNLDELKRLLTFAFGFDAVGDTVAEVLHNVANELEKRKEKPQTADAVSNVADAVEVETKKRSKKG